MTSSSSSSSDTRLLALRVLLKIDEKKIPLDRTLNDVSFSRKTLSAKDNALFNALVYGVLRMQGKLDYILNYYLHEPFSKLPFMLQAILRMGLYQISYMDRIPSSAAVNTSVELAKKMGAPSAAGLINAILRRAVQEGTNIPLPVASSPEYVAITQSFPLWLVNRWNERYGLEETEQLCAKMNEVPPLTIRVNSMKTNRSDLLQKISRHVRILEPALYSPLGIRLFQLQSPLETWPEYQEGLFQIQDEAAQLAGFLFAPQEQETLFDACAGLGGKTGQMAISTRNNADILAVDLFEKKLAQLRAEINRLGVTCVSTQTIDLSQPLPLSFGNRFDRIFLDSPCSGLGVLRRNPDAKWISDKKDLKSLQKQQIQFLTHVSFALRPGGTLLYVVCSMEHAENEKVVNIFLKKNPNFAIVTETKTLPDFLKPFVNEEGLFRTYPHQHDMDGFFAVRFTKTT